jgi:hypothetical protein
VTIHLIDASRSPAALDRSGLHGGLSDVFENCAMLLCDAYSKIADAAPLVGHFEATGECAARHLEHRFRVTYPDSRRASGPVPLRSRQRSATGIMPRHFA